MRDECEHGSLRRSCNLCCLRRERDEARADLERLVTALRSIASTDAPLSQDDMQIARDALAQTTASTPECGRDEGAPDA